MHADPHLPKPPLIFSYQQKNIWPKLVWFQSIFTVGGWRIYPFKLPFCALHPYPHRVVKGPHLEAWTRPEPEITSPNPAWAPHLFLKPDLGLKANLSGEFRYAQLRSETNIVCRFSWRDMFYRTENSNHFDQNIFIIWHKRSMLVKDNTAEYNVFQEKKKLSRNYLRWRCRHKRNVLG